MPTPRPDPSAWIAWLRTIDDLDHLGGWRLFIQGAVGLISVPGTAERLRGPVQARRDFGKATDDVRMWERITDLAELYRTFGADAFARCVDEILRALDQRRCELLLELPEHQRRP